MIERSGGLPERSYTNYYTNAALSKCIVHRASGNATHVGQNVAVDVERQAHVFMSKQLLDKLGIHTLTE